MTMIKRKPRSFNLEERTALKRIERAGDKGATAIDIYRSFKRQLSLVEQTKILSRLHGLNMIEPLPSPHGTRWIKAKPREPRPPKDDKRVPREGCVWRNGQWESADPTLLRSFTCFLWPNLCIAARGKEIRFANGRACTSDPELVALIEKAHGFGMHVLQDDVAVEIKEENPPVTVAIHP
jgi:hypothetical protein